MRTRALLRGLSVLWSLVLILGVVVGPGPAYGAEAGSDTSTTSTGTGSDGTGIQAAPYLPDAIPRYQYDLSAEHIPSSQATRATDYFAAIYSGSTSGVYFYVAAAICNVLEMRFQDHHIHCVALRSSGVGGNVQLMREGRAQMAIVQSDTNYLAAVGTLPIPGARSVMSLHGESGVMVVDPQAGIRGVQDLRGKRVNIGPEGSGNRALWGELLRYDGVALSELEQVYNVQQSYDVQGLCDHYIEAFGVWIGHPSSLIQDAIDKCGAKVVGMDNGSEGLNRLLSEHQYYVRTTIPKGTYSNQTEDIQSYGFKASLIAAKDASPYVIYWVVRTLVEEIAALRSAHPALAAIQPRDMFEEGNFLPFHDGAARYWKGRGWLTDPAPGG